MTPDDLMLASIRKKQPDATEREAFLLEHLIGAMGMVRKFTEKSGSTYTWGTNYDRDAFALFNDWLLENYGWTLAWGHKAEQKPKARETSR